MKTAARLLINISGNGKSYILWNGTETYYEKLRLAYIDFLNNSIDKNNYFGFFILCAATLEYSLNFILSDFCLKDFGHIKYKSQAEKLIKLPFAKN